MSTYLQNIINTQQNIGSIYNQNAKEEECVTSLETDNRGPKLFSQVPDSLNVSLQ